MNPFGTVLWRSFSRCGYRLFPITTVNAVLQHRWKLALNGHLLSIAFHLLCAAVLVSLLSSLCSFYHHLQATCRSTVTHTHTHPNYHLCSPAYLLAERSRSALKHTHIHTYARTHTCMQACTHTHTQTHVRGAY